MKREKGKRSVFTKIIFGLLIFVGAILLIIGGWFAFCSMNKKDSVQAIPNDFTIHVRTDSVWDALEPVLDLNAADYVLADPAFSAYRELFLNFRLSSLRSNFFVKKALQRRIDITVYENKSYLLVADMGFFSGISRLFPLANKFLHIKNLSSIQNSEQKYFIYEKDENNKFFIKIYKNLIVLTPDEELFNKALSFDNKKDYSEKELKPLSQQIKDPFIISADGIKVLKMLFPEENNAYVNAVSQAISKDEFSTIYFEINDSDLSLKADFPFILDDSTIEHPVAKLIKKESTVPSLLGRLPETVQYYTFLNSLSLEEVVKAAFSILPSDMSIENKWQLAENASNILFRTSLEDILYSWTDNEFAICGLESKADPIIAIKIKDEKKRQEVFDNILSSITLKNDNSLLIDGIRLPRITMPVFFQNLLDAFGINLPEPYYIIKNDYIYFSQSPENLVTVYNAANTNKKLSNSENWNKVSSKQTPISTVSLYYNLERSIPFFLKSKTTISDVLKLYNIGRFDLSSKDNLLSVQLQATVSQFESSLTIPGFPIELPSSVSGSLCKSNIEKSKTIFWIEDKNTVSAMNQASLNIISKNIKDINYLIPASEKQKNSDGELWAVSKTGTVYLLTKDLDIVDKFPVYTSKITTKPVLYQDSLLITTDNNLFVTIGYDGTITENEFYFVENMQSSPATLNNYIAVYEKSFIGGIYLLKDKTEVTEDSKMLDGIAYGSPVLFQNGKKTYTSIITQNGTLYLFDEGLNEKENFPVYLPGLFYINVQYADNYLFALSSEGILYQVDMNGNVTQIDIPNLKSKSGTIFVYDYNNDGKSEVFINGEGNTIYGFTSSLNMLENFPVSGFTNPVFADFSGDKKEDCITLSIDNKLNAYNVIGK